MVNLASRKSKWPQVKKHIDNGNIRKWKRTMNERQIAAMCGVSMGSFSTYKNEHPELVEELAIGNCYLAEELRSVAIKRALGYKYEEKKSRIQENPDGTKIKVIEKTEKEMPPNIRMLEILLSIYDAEWKESCLSLGEELGGGTNFSKQTNETLDDILEALKGLGGESNE